MRRLAFLVVLAGCGDSDCTCVPDAGPDATLVPDARPGPAVLALSPLTHDFGGVSIGCAGTPQTFTVTNAGESLSNTISVALMGSGATAFAITTDSCSGTKLGAAATCTFVVGTGQLTPGAKSATVVVTGGGSVSGTLVLTALAAATLGVSPAAIAFPSTVAGTTSTAMTATFTNAGGCMTTGSLVTSLAGSDPTSFAITSDTCAGQALATGASCTVGIAFAPTAAGSRAATLTVSSSLGAAVVALSGDATAAPAKLQIAPMQKDFGAVNIGCSTTDATTFTVTNVGGSTSTAIATALGGSDAGQFAIGADACSGMALAPGGTCSIAATFHPTAPGAKTASLTATATGTSAQATLLGTGLSSDDLSVSPASVSFGDVTVGTSSAAKTVTLSSGGGCPGSGKLTLSMSGNDPAMFATANDTCSGAMLSGGQTCTVDVVFSPTATGSRSANLTFVATPGGVVNVAFAGTGQ